MKKLITLSVATLLTIAAMAQTDSIQVKKNRLSLGGYGEAVMTRNFYSDHIYRYSKPEAHADDDSHGRFDLPHVVFFVGYDFGKGWKMNTEIEFEHGGLESAVEMEAEESGEYEAEVERGGEVALEQFWIQKTFSDAANIRAGEIIIPIGLTNQGHLPNEFFTVYRPEGENTILPCTWHQVGISFWGRTDNWKYEAIFTSGLNADQFGNESFVHYGAASPYEFKVANNYAGVLRIDNYSISGLRLGLSGYAGPTFENSLSKNTKYKDCKGTLVIGAFDFQYKNEKIVARGYADYAHLSDAYEIGLWNRETFATKYDDSPSKRQYIGSDAVALSLSIGSYLVHRKKSENALLIFGHYEYYNSFLKGKLSDTYQWCGKHRIALGLNYMPMKEIVIKAEYSKRFLKSQYNNEPSISMSIAYSGFFQY